MSGWCTIESDPAVFTEMLQRFGVQGLAVREFITCDELLTISGKFYGLILLFKWKESSMKRQVLFPDSSPLYFAKQVVNNACATQAIVNVLLNFPTEILLGDALTQFLDFTAGLDPATRGELIGQSEVLRNVHNSFARTTAFSFEEERRARASDDVYHFVGFIYKGGGVFELDGLQEGPIRVADANDENWGQAMHSAVSARMTELSQLDTTGSGQGISFALMAVVQDPIVVLQQKLVAARIAKTPILMLQEELAAAEAERAKGVLENIRRRHNYIPALVALFRALAEKGKLQGIVDGAKKREADRKAAKIEQKKT